MGSNPMTFTNYEYSVTVAQQPPKLLSLGSNPGTRAKWFGSLMVKQLAVNQ